LKQLSASATARPPSLQSCACGQAATDQIAERILRCNLSREVEPWWAAGFAAVDHFQEVGAAHFIAKIPSKITRSPSALKNCVVIHSSRLDQTDHRHGRRGIDHPGRAFVVSETLPPMTGVAKARQASASPSTASRICQKFSGL
jgi:hypothetical protein